MSIKLLDHKVMRSFIVFNSDLVEFFSNVETVEELPLSHEIIQPSDSDDGIYFIHYKFKYEPVDDENSDNEKLTELAIIDMFFRFEVRGENAQQTLEECVPAICYPYMRSFLSTLFANSGVESIYLPLWLYKK